MNCSELDQLLCPYLDGEFSAADRIDMESHLATCAACARKVHEEARFRNVFRATAQAAQADIAAPAALRARIQSGVAAQSRRVMLQRAWPYAAAAAVVVVAGASYQLAKGPVMKRSFLEDATARHAKNLPVEVRVGDPAQMEPWFDGKLDEPVRVPHLNAQLVGGRLANLKDKDVGYVTYEAPSPDGARHRVGVFVIPDRNRELDAPTRANAEVDQSRGYSVAYWRDDEIVYITVSDRDMDEDDVRRMLSAQELTAEVPVQPQPMFEIQPAGLEH